MTRPSERAITLGVRQTGGRSALVGTGAVLVVVLAAAAALVALQQTAAATGGKAYLARDPADIRGVFLDAIIERRCRPTC